MSEVSTAVSPASANSSRVVSRLSGRMTFPRSSKSMSSKSLVDVIKHTPVVNPFKVPPGQDIFMMRDKEKIRKKEEREKQRQLKVHEKTTYASRVNANTAAMRKEVLGTDEDESLEVATKGLSIKDDPAWSMAVTRDRNVEKEDLADYVEKKREMFLVQYSLAVKREEMSKLEELAAAEERKLERAERFLENDATMFDEFLKDNDRNSVEAIKVAETETRAKLEKVVEIKKNSAMMMAIRSEISKHEETLRDYMLYKKFLYIVTPREWKAEKRAKKLDSLRAREHPQQHHPVSKQRRPTLTPAKKRVDGESRASSRGPRDAVHPKTRKKSILRGSPVRRGTGNPSTLKNFTDSESVRSAEANLSDDESDEEPVLYFSDPRQLLAIFQELEEQNLSLITNSQETEEAMEELKQTIRVTKEKLHRETGILKSQINILKGTIGREEEKADNLELKSKIFSYGEFKAEDQDRMLKQLHRRVEEVFKVCIGDNEANISTLHMLASIENRLEELFESIDFMPRELVEAAEKAKEKERRMRLREEKLAAQRAHQEERIRKALERAKADPKKRAGKRLVFRSEPPQRKHKENIKKDARDREEEERQFYFT